MNLYIILFIGFLVVLLFVMKRIENLTGPDDKEIALRAGIPERDIYPDEQDHLTKRYERSFEIDPLPYGN